MIAIRVLQDSRVVREAVFSALPVTVGRAATNAVVLADPSVSRVHARIECGEDGRVRIVDLSSRNGLYVEGQPAPSAVLDRRLTLRLGQTELQVEPVSDSPTLEVPFAARSLPDRRRGMAARLVYVALGVAGIVANDLLEASFWSPWNHTRSVSVLGSATAALVLLPTLAGILFLVLKVIGRRVRMADTLRALGLLAWLAPAAQVVLLAAYYPLSPSQYALFQMGLVAVAAAVSFAVLASVRREPRSHVFSLGWAATVLVIVVGIISLSAMGDRKRGEPNVDLKLQPPVAGYAGRAESFDSFLAGVRRAATADAQGVTPANKGDAHRGSDPKRPGSRHNGLGGDP